MTTHAINALHLDALTRSEHVLKWLQAEQARIQLEAMTIGQQWQREEAKLRALLDQAYGIRGEFTLDTKAGTITTKEADSEPTAE